MTPVTNTKFPKATPNQSPEKGKKGVTVPSIHTYPHNPGWKKKCSKNVSERMKGGKAKRNKAQQTLQPKKE